MLYYQGYTVSFQEVPDEVSLVLLVADCPMRCPGCHSPELQEKRGENLEEDLQYLIDKYKDAISCVCLMGEGQDKGALIRCADIIHKNGLKSAIYTGREQPSFLLLSYGRYFDYFKTGAYDAKRGGLSNPNTNQRMYKVTGRISQYAYNFDDITYKFQQKML